MLSDACFEVIKKIDIRGLSALAEFEKSVERYSSPEFDYPSGLITSLRIFNLKLRGDRLSVDKFKRAIFIVQNYYDTPPASISQEQQREFESLIDS